ncbi:hypothetical protein OIU74_001958 [Salix koriyanagi]|uniref:Uncharacterized protein n=1 Tax=Salix koriyanagi TaxID=2511006 RepID=A0A9Q0X317_9ROSI|nr:hypothetical protein OIU74_001958 [Salix koriyanagi]
MGMSKQVLKQRRGILGMNYEKIVKHKERYKDITVCFVKNQSIHKPLNKTGRSVHVHASFRYNTFTSIFAGVEYPAVAREQQSAEYIHSSIAKQSKMQKLHKFTGFPNLYYPFLVKFKVSPSSSAEIPFTEGRGDVGISMEKVKNKIPEEHWPS